MAQYGIYESAEKAREPVESYEDLTNHHPSQKFKEKGRTYGVVDGHMEEIRQEQGEKLVSKDFVLYDSNKASSPSEVGDSAKKVSVPAPVAAKVKADPSQGMVEFYDVQSGEFIARIRHMSDLKVKTGDIVEYGQPLGTQDKVNAPHVHVHIDFNEQYLDQFKKYIRDIDSGVITTDKYPTKTPDMHYNGSQLEPVNKQSSLEVPDNFKSLEASAEKNVRDLYAQAGIDFADGGQNTVGKVVYEAAKANLTEVEQMTVKDGQIHIAQKDPSGFGYTTASFGAVEAANTDYSKSMDGLVALNNPQQVASLTPDQNKTIDEPTKARSIA